MTHLNQFRWTIIGIVVLIVDVALYGRNPLLRDFLGGQAWIYYLYLSAIVGVSTWVVLTIGSCVAVAAQRIRKLLSPQGHTPLSQ